LIINTNKDVVTLIFCRSQKVRRALFL